MRIPVFARRANPCVDRPILKKSLLYATEQVEAGRASWVDPAFPRLGIICRELLYFGEPSPARLENPPTLHQVLPPVEAPGTRYIGRPTSPVLSSIRRGLMIRARLWAKAAEVPA